jgi:hypothetical protein
MFKPLERAPVLDRLALALACREFYEEMQSRLSKHISLTPDLDVRGEGVAILTILTRNLEQLLKAPDPKTPPLGAVMWQLAAMAHVCCCGGAAPHDKDPASALSRAVARSRNWNNAKHSAEDDEALELACFHAIVNCNDVPVMKHCFRYFAWSRALRDFMPRVEQCHADGAELQKALWKSVGVEMTEDFTALYRKLYTGMLLPPGLIEEDAAMGGKRLATVDTWDLLITDAEPSRERMLEIDGHKDALAFAAGPDNADKAPTPQVSAAPSEARCG